MSYFIDNKIKCLPVFQNQQDFLIGVFSIGTILKFTKYTKRLIVGFDEENLPIYNPQIQRDLENLRVQKIADFLIDDPNATFPTNIVLHIPSLIVDSQKQNNGFVEIQVNNKVFDGVERSRGKDDAGDVYITIIDGQHRIRGIEVALERIDGDIRVLAQTLQGSPNNLDLKKKLDRYSQRRKDLLNIQLVVSFFIDKTLEYQAMIFSTINRTQKRVSDSLVSSLFGLTTEDSPQKTALQVVLALNAHDKSPFFNRINLYGNDYDNNQSPPLSQAGMVKSIVNLICESLRESERDRFKERKLLSERTAGSQKYLPFRGYYVANKDSSISDILFYYFKAVKNVFVDDEKNSYWDFNPESMKPTNILQTTVGYTSFLNMLIDILKELPEKERYEVKSYENYLKKAKNINVKDLKRYPFTSKSQSIIYLDLSLAIFPPIDNSDKRVLRLYELLNKD
ncbi:MAG: DGQHR domain-containing protein [Bacteroidota bacterium]